VEIKSKSVKVHRKKRENFQTTEPLDYRAALTHMLCRHA